MAKIKFSTDYVNGDNFINKLDELEGTLEEAFKNGTTLELKQEDIKALYCFLKCAYL